MRQFAKLPGLSFELPADGPESWARSGSVRSGMLVRVWHTDRRRCFAPLRKTPCWLHSRHPARQTPRFEMARGQESPGKEDGCNLKPFIAVQRVRRPPGKGAARQPEASLAWVAATPLVKRRQRILKPWVSLKIMFRWSLRRVGTGGSIDWTASGEVLSVRPGSGNRAKVWDGLPGNRRGPVRAHLRDAGAGSPADQRPQARRRTSAPSGAPLASTNTGGAVGARNRSHKGPGLPHGTS